VSNNELAGVFTLSYHNLSLNCDLSTKYLCKVYVNPVGVPVVVTIAPPASVKVKDVVPLVAEIV
jgi:hypothetical protein